MKKIPDDIRKDIPLLEKYVYLDSTATGLTPRPVIEAMNSYYLEYRANIHRGVHKLSQEASLAYEEAHRKVAKLLNAKEDEIVLTYGTTYSINAIALGLDFEKAGIEKVLVTEVEHHSNLIPWIRLAKLGKIKLEIVKTDKEGNIDLEDLASKAKNSLIATHHVSNVLGVIQPVEEISKIAREGNSLILLDAAQSVGHMPVDVKRLGIDFLAFSGHKGLLGPTGIGGLYIREEVKSFVEPVMLGGGTVSDSDVKTLSYTLEEFPWSFEPGTPNIAGGIGLGAAVDYILSIGLDKIERYEEKLTRMTLDGLDELGIEWYGPREKAAVISFNVRNLDPHEVAGFLDMNGIAVRSGHHCASSLMKKLGVEGTVRASYHCYNTKEEIEKMLDVLRELV